MTKLTHLKVYKRRFKKPLKGNAKGSALTASQDPPGLMGAKNSSHDTQSTMSKSKLTMATRWVIKTPVEAALAGEDAVSLEFSTGKWSGIIFLGR
jgi:hypothetical protein